MSPDDLKLFDQIPLSSEQPPQYFVDLAKEISEEMADGDNSLVRFDPLLIIALASLLFSVFKYCQQRRVERVITRAARYPNGMTAALLRAKLKSRAGSIPYSEKLANTIIAVAYRRLQVPGAWTAAGG